MKTSQDYYSMHFCVLGTIQLSLLYGKSEFIKEIPYLFILSPALSYLIIEIMFAIIEILNSDDVSQSKALSFLVNFATLGLEFTSLILLIESLDSEFNSLLPIFVPLFLILTIHGACRVINKPPAILAGFLNFLTPALTVCTINGTCSSMYVSIFSSVFSAFGVSISDFITILNPLTYLLLFFTVLSLFFAKNTIWHPPFILGMISATSILLFQYLNLFMMVFIANILLIVSVLWNNQVIRDTGIKSI